MTTESTGCNCLCAVNHKTVRGVCAATADTALVFHSETTGRVDVAMCSACAAATLAAKGEERGEA